MYSFKGRDFSKQFSVRAILRYVLETYAVFFLVVVHVNCIFAKLSQAQALASAEISFSFTFPPPTHLHPDKSSIGPNQIQ